MIQSAIKPAQKRKRRGVILSSWGWQRLQDVQEQLAIARNGGYAYTLEQLSHLTGLSVRSITRLQSRKVAVDRQTLEEFFCAFDLTLTEQDYLQPDPLQPNSLQPNRPPQVPEPDPRLVHPIAQDWGEAPDVSFFYGRTSELSILKQWILQDNCRLIGMFGMGGIGKTTLSVKLAEQVQDQFTYVIWRSLRNAPLLETLLADLVTVLSGQQRTQADISSFLQCLRNHRCLVILDNVESLLDSGSRSGQYRPGCEAYGELLRVVAETRHQSCLVLTAREKCAQSGRWEGQPAVQSMTLRGSPEASQAFLEATGLTGLAHQKQMLCDRYRCNPLALKIVATTIRELFDGNIALFLEQNITLFGDIFDLIQRHYSRLSILEKQVMLWLAIHREWVSFAQLQADLNGNVSPIQLMETLQRLQGRSLIETYAGQFTLQPVVMEYVTETVLDQVCDEIVNHSSSTPLSPTALLHTHALIKAQDKDDVRDNQIRVILTSLTAKLLSRLGSRKEIVYHLQQILSHLQTECLNVDGYAGSNIINLLCHLQVDLSDYNASYLNIWQANCQNANPHRVKFGHQGTVRTVAWQPNGHLFASGGDNHAIRLCDVQTKTCLKVLQGHSNGGMSV